MDDILCSLLQAISENAFASYDTSPEYLQSRRYAEQQSEWLEERLNDEERIHLEQLRQAELRVISLECEAEIRLALALGIRLALAS